MDVTKLAWQKTGRKIPWYRSKKAIACTLLVICGALVYVRSIYFFTFPSTWLYEHGCASTATSSSRVYDIRGGGDVERNAQDILKETCVPLSFTRMSSRVRTLINLTKSLATGESDQVKQTERESLRDDLTQHLFPFLSDGLTRKRRTISDLSSSYTQDKGIVIPTGDSHWHMAAHSIAIIRKVHNCSLPIQIVYAGDSDLSPSTRQALNKIGPDVEMVDLLNYFDEDVVKLEHGGWAIKPFAMLATRFKEVILADADAVFLQSPDVLFNDKGYQQTGVFLFHDEDWAPHRWTRHYTRGKPWAEATFKSLDSRWVRGEIEHEAESGVVVMNKEHGFVLLGLLFTSWMNTRKVRNAVTYHYTWGDKESYWMALQLTNLPYHFENNYTSTIGLRRGGVLCGHLLHLNASGAPLWHNNGMWRAKKFPERGIITHNSWMENIKGWRRVCMHSADGNIIHDLKGTPLGDIVAQNAKIAKEVEDQLIGLGPDSG